MHFAAIPDIRGGHELAPGKLLAVLLRIAIVAGCGEARVAVEKQRLLRRESGVAVRAHAAAVAGTARTGGGAGAGASQDASGVLRRV